MANSSATGGYLSPATLPSSDIELSRTLHDAIAGITGLSGSLVRPKWQPNPPAIPASSVDWCAFGAGNFVAGLPYQVQVTSGADTRTRYEQHERFDCDVTFYGPMCKAYATILREGVNIAQNREALWLEGISIIGTSQIIRAPELVNDVWLDRCDVTIMLGRKVDLSYNIVHFTAADGTIRVDVPQLTMQWQTGEAAGIFDLTFDGTFG